MAVTLKPNDVPAITRSEPMSYFGFLDDTNFLPISTVTYPTDPLLSAVQVHQRYAQLTYQLNPTEISGTVNINDTGLAQEAKQDVIISRIESTNTAIGNLLTELQQKVESTDTLAVSTVNQPTGVATDSNQEVMILRLGALTAVDYATQSTLYDVLTAVRDNKTPDIGVTFNEYALSSLQLDQITVLHALTSINITHATEATLGSVLTATQAINETLTTTTINVSTVNAPQGASTEAKQDLQVDKLDALTAKDFATETTLANIETAITGTVAVSTVNQPVGVATEAKQDTQITKLDVLTSIQAVHDETKSHDRFNAIGAVALTALPAAVSNNDFVRILLDEYGRAVTKAYNYTQGADDVYVTNLNANKNSVTTTLLDAVTGNETSSNILVEDYIYNSVDFIITAGIGASTVELVVETTMDDPTNGLWVQQEKQTVSPPTSAAGFGVNLQGITRYLRVRLENNTGYTITTLHMGGN